MSLPPPANLECSRLHHLCARSSVHTCTRRARHSSAISHLHRLPSEVHPPSHPIPFQRGRGRREAAQPIVTGTWSTRHSLRRLAVCGPSWSFYSADGGWPSSRVRAYPNTVELIKPQTLRPCSGRGRRLSDSQTRGCGRRHGGERAVRKVALGTECDETPLCGGGAAPPRAPSSYRQHA